jgi:predicted metal-dependent HD superfamily phosphohydrolase
MGKEVTRGQLLGWVVPIIIAVCGAAITMYAATREHEYRLNAIERHEEQKSFSGEAINQRLQKIENSITRIETILEMQAKDRQELSQAEAGQSFLSKSKSERMALLREAAEQAAHPERYREKGGQKE